MVYVNTIITLPRRTVQSMTYSFGGEFTDLHRELHAQFLAVTRIEAPE